MRVGLNATCFNDRPSGANQRFLGIYGALVRRRPDIHFIVYEPSDCRVAGWFGDAPNVSARSTPIPSVGRLARLRAGLGYWRRQLRQDRLDLFEGFHLPLVRAPGCPTLLTIHDLRPILATESPLRRLAGRIVLRRALTDAAHIIAVSDTVAGEIRAFQPSAAVSTVYNGVDPADFAAVDDAAVAVVRARYDLPDAYLLAVGHLEARKNLPLLIAAVARLRDRGLHRPLVIVGNDGGGRDEVRDAIAAHGVADRVTLVEGADFGTLRALYTGCRLLAYPSRYEGFGIPILEAMAAGRPMALAETAVFRELTEGQGAYFPVDDPEAAATMIERVWSDPDERARQSDYAAARLPDFTFDRLADRVAALYARLVPSRQDPA